MGWILQYGLDQHGELDLDHRAIVAGNGPAPPQQSFSVGDRLAAALENPLGFPPLRQSIIPGDHISIVLEQDLPYPAQLVQGVVEVLLQADIAPQDISLLCPAHGPVGGEDPTRLLAGSVRRRIRVLTHDPSDPGCLAYLASTEAGHRVVLNRAIVDADVVVAIGCQQSQRAPDYFGPFGGVYPSFADRHALQRFRAWALAGNPGAGKRLLMAEVQEVAWLLGSAFAIQVVPGPGEQLVAILAGEIRKVTQASRLHYAAFWQQAVPRRARLVVAAIPGGPQQQTWRRLAQALAAAYPLVERGGAIAVCCSLSEPPGPAIQALIGAKHPAQALRRLGPDWPDDLLQAVQLLRSRRHAQLFLLSGLDPQLVEALKLRPLPDFGHLAHLVRQAASCIVLPDAPRAMVRVQSAETS